MYTTGQLGTFYFYIFLRLPMLYPPSIAMYRGILNIHMFDFGIYFLFCLLFLHRWWHWLGLLAFVLSLIFIKKKKILKKWLKYSQITAAHLDFAFVHILKFHHRLTLYFFSSLLGIPTPFWGVCRHSSELRLNDSEEIFFKNGIIQYCFLNRKASCGISYENIAFNNYYIIL